MTPNKTSSQPEALQGRPAEQASTVQLLVANEGNRRAIRGMLTDEFVVETSQTVQEADLYLVEDRLLPTYRDELREQITRSHPAFCPVVVIQREQTRLSIDWADTHDPESETPLLVDEFVEAPVSQQLLVSRLRSLLVRREQSLELLAQMETLARQERDLRRFERAFEDSGTATVITDSDGTIEYVNTAFEEMTGYSQSDVLGQSLEGFLAEDALGMVDDSFWRTMAEKDEWEGELLIQREDDHRCITDTTITPIRDDVEENEGFVVAMPDITPRIEREQRLQEREAELDLLRQILSRYLRHNLRNKLNVILSYAEGLEADLPEEEAQDVKNIIETTERLMEMSEEARKYSTFIDQEGALTLHNVSTIVTESVSDTRERYPDVSIEIDIDDGCQVLARDGLREAIHGLIDNAARHNDADAPWVQVTVTETAGTQVVIEDNGPGISELELKTLEQGTETPLTHSQGIGLWLSTWVIESIDGQISFEETSDGGTRVTLTFPPTDRAESQEIAVSDLKAREQRLQTITQRMTDAVIEVNPAWQITYVDTQAEEILSVDAAAIQGRLFWDVFADIRDTRFEAVYRDVMKSRSAASIEEYYAGIDGWLEVFVYPDFDGGLSFYFRDVTAQNEREQDLERARSRIELALEVTDAAVWEWDPETDAVTVHPERHPVFETKVRTVDDFIEGVHPDDRARVENALETAVETGSSYDIEYRVRTGETVRWAADYGEVQSDEDGNAIRLVGVARDITERKQRDQELAETRDLLERTERVAEVGGWEIDTETMDVFWTDSLYEILGVERDMEPSLDDAFDLYHEDDRALIENVVETALDSGEPFDVEARIRQPSGTVRWLHIQGIPTVKDGEVVTLRGAVQDITERKEREQHLQEEQQFVKSIFDALPDPLYAFDTEGDPLRWNDKLESVTGYTADEIADLSLTDFVPEDEADKVATQFQTILEDRQSATVEAAFETKHGERIPYEFTGSVLESSDGMIRGVTGIGRDITERKERERALEERVKELTALQETAQTFLRTDAALDELFERFIQRLPQSFQYPEVTAAKIAYKEYEASTADFKSDERCLTGQIETENDGTVRIDVVYLEERPAEDDGPFLTEEQELLDTLASLIGSYVDRREYIQQLEQQNTQLEAFTSIVSHDLRNPLNVAQLRMELLAGEYESEHIEPIEAAHRRIETLIEDMLTLTRHGTQVGETESVVLSEVVDSCWQAVDTADATLAIGTEQTIRADVSRLRQLVENILRNAVEHGGPAVSVVIGDLDNGFYIEDDGPGIAPEERDTVFEAGYSASSDGTGLGLSIVKEIVEGHGWTCHVTDGAQGGARIEIRDGESDK